jgi:hypothetical protein
VEEDFAVGTPCESLEESEVRKLAFERLRRSLKKEGMLDLTDSSSKRGQGFLNMVLVM